MAIWVIFLLCSSLCFAKYPFERENWESGDIFIEDGSSLYYFLFRSRLVNQNKTLIIWLNGGPGSSSTLGLFMENGPYMLDYSLNYKYNPHSWNKEYDVVYVEEPPGTGNSVVKDSDHLCQNESCVAKCFFSFLLKFYALYPEYRGRDLFITGESYGGHYVPAIAEYVHKANNPFIRLKGIAIGNGISDYIQQQPQYATYLWKYEIIGVISTIIGKIQSVICNFGIIYDLPFYPYFCARLPFIQGSSNNVVNIYDIRLNHTYEKQNHWVNTLMNSAEIRKLFKSEDRVFADFNRTVYEKMRVDMTVTVYPSLNYLADSGLNILLYYGDMDFICNWVGGEVMANNIKWTGQSSFQNAQYVNWTASTGVTGRYKKYNNLKFLVFYGAGHLVPMDKPLEAYEMLQQFLHNNF